ncbi:glycosyltransferase [Myxococcota bacterium]|nr:glycosyltransferase [Myxococcota bacterium]
MRILQVTPYYEPDFQKGGIVRSTSILCRELVRQGHSVTVWTTQAPEGTHHAPLHAPIDLGGVEVVYFRNWGGGFWFDEFMLRVVSQIEQYDLVHVAAFWQLFGWPALMAARRRGIATVISPRGSLVMVHNRAREAWKHRAMYWLYNHRALQQASALHFTASIERDDAVSLGLTTPMFRVANALAAEDFQNLPDREASRRHFSIQGDQPVILFLGRLDRRKALDVLIEGFARAEQTRDRAVLFLAGPDDGVEQSLREQVRSLGLDSRVRFLGMVDAETRARLFAAADLSTLTSHAENFGNAAGEAMSAGLPVLVSETCGIAEHIEEYGAGRVVPVEADAIAASLSEMLCEPARLVEMGARARCLVTEQYTASAVARTMARAYQDVLSGERSAESDWLYGG